jgi:hypothetical protein
MLDRLRRSPVGWVLRRVKRRLRPAKIAVIPPPEAEKRRIVLDIAQQHGLRVFVETGTFLGEMVEALRSHCDRVYSIELDPELFRRATERFAGDTRVTILEGDSAEVLPGVLAAVDQPALFWLDGHHSGAGTAKGATSTPILAELGHVFGHQTTGHVILIDDARLFDGTRDYPTIKALRRLVERGRRGATFEIRDDIIRIY